MIKNLNVNIAHPKYKIDKRKVHCLVMDLRNDLEFKIEMLVINFITASEIHKINIEYLKHDYSTDIITFNYNGDNIILNGELYISIDDANDYSRIYKCPLDEELIRLVIHGILHLVGYDDMCEKDLQIMKEKENFYVKKLKNKIGNLCNATK